MEIDMSEELLRLPEVAKLVKKSRATIYTDMRRGDFPLPISLGRRAMAWRRSDLDVWLNTRQQRTYNNETLETKQ
jgi:prophage regulatory protein